MIVFSSKIKTRKKYVWYSRIMKYGGKLDSDLLPTVGRTKILVG